MALPPPYMDVRTLLVQIRINTKQWIVTVVFPMAFRPDPPPPVSAEFKEENREDYKDSFDWAQEKIAGLHAINKELVLSNERLDSKLLKKKAELEKEKSSLQTSKQLISELNVKIEFLENPRRIPPNSAPFPDAREPHFFPPDPTEVQKLKSENSELKGKVKQLQHDMDALEYELSFYQRRCVMMEIFPEKVIPGDCSKSQTLPTAPRTPQTPPTKSPTKPPTPQKPTTTRKPSTIRKPPTPQELPTPQKPTTTTTTTTQKATTPQEPPTPREEPQPQPETVKIKQMEATQHLHRISIESIPVIVGTPHPKGTNSFVGHTPPSASSTKIQATTPPDKPVMYRVPTPTAETNQLKGDIAKDTIYGIKKMFNETKKTPSKLQFRPGFSVNVVKLKSFLNAQVPKAKIKQVIVLVNKRYELGVVMGIFDVDNKMGFRNSMTTFAGVRLVNAGERSSGKAGGKFYFECEDNCGLFVPVGEVFVPVL